MKKILTVVTAIVLVALMAFSVCAADDITVTLNGAEVDCASYGQPATIVNGRTLVPLRAIFEALGASVKWDQATKTVTSALGDTSVELTIDIPVMYVNGEAKELDVAGTIMNGRTLVPARAVAEAFGVGVEWDAATRTVILTKSDAPDGAILWKYGGDNFESIEDTYAGDGILTVVDNPTKPGDKVLHIEATVTDRQCWTYLWIPRDGMYKAGQKYLVTFSFMADADCFGNPIARAALGANIKVGPDKGIVSKNVSSGEWANVAVTYTVPEGTDMDQTQAFGVYASPVTVEGFDYNLAWSFYVDNISVVPYEGDTDDCNELDPALFMEPTGAAVPVGFNYAAAAGMEIDLARLTSGEGGYVPSSKTFEFDTQGNNTDPLAMFDVTADAATYKAVAVKFKRVDAPDAIDVQMFFATDASPNMSEDKSLHCRYIDCGVEDGSYVAYLDFAGLETADLWTGTVTKLRLDPGNGNGKWSIEGIKLIEA